MGGEPYWYVVPYEADIDAALQKLRKRELLAGRYNPVMPFLTFPIDVNSPAPGGQHATFDDAMEDADADGTRSIIDLQKVSPQPWDGRSDRFFTVYPVAKPDLVAWFGTDQPGRAAVVDAEELWESLDRGSGAYVVLYDKGKPTEIFFAGYSFD
jgi:hypothetical protein